MRLFGLTITRRKDVGTLSPADNRGGWWPIIRESFTGAWQRGEEIRVDMGLSNATLFRCVVLIASDMAKMALQLLATDADGILIPTTSPAFSPVLRNPNRYQNTIQFIIEWMLSKLLHGNTYVLKQRDGRGVVTALYVLNPLRVKPLVAPDGAVYYDLQIDHLSGLQDAVIAPASEIIHDRMNTLFHPLVGVSPIYACGLAAMQGIEIQRDSTRFFKNGSRPGGILSAAGKIGQETADRLKAHWEANFTGEKVGNIAVLGDGLKFEPMALSAVDAELVDQLKWTSETICSAYGIPAYMVGVGAAPLNNNVEALQQQYFSQCLQIHSVSFNTCLSEGLGLGPQFGNAYCVQSNLDDLLRMDTAALIETLCKGILGGLYKPDEARKKVNLGKVKGGDTVYLQQQNYSLAALDARDHAGPAGHPAPPAPAPAQLALPAPISEFDHSERAALETAAAIVAMQSRFAREPALCLT